MGSILVQQLLREGPNCVNGVLVAILLSKAPEISALQEKLHFPQVDQLNLVKVTVLHLLGVLPKHPKHVGAALARVYRLQVKD